MSTRQIPSADNLHGLAVWSLKLVQAIREYLPVTPEIVPQEPITSLDRHQALMQVARIAQMAANCDYRAEEESGHSALRVVFGWPICEVDVAWSHTARALKAVLEHYGWTSLYGKEAISIASEGVRGQRDGKDVPLEEVVASNVAVVRLDQSGPPIPATTLSKLEHHAAILFREVKNAIGSVSPESNCRHSRDFRSVVWYGTSYSFTSTQAPAVKILWEAWSNGTPEVGQLSILESIGSESRRLSDLFANSPAWKTMIVDGKTKGAYCLSDPSK
jgi:hypothetical protein